MAYTVIGVYDVYSRAEAALRDLLSHGFPHHKLYLTPIEEAPAGQAAALRELDKLDEQSTSRQTLPEFFRALFGQDHSNRDIYLEAVRRGSYVLMANADNDQEADQAMEIMARYGPTDIDEMSSHWRRQGWSGFDPVAAAMTQDDIEREHSSYTEEKPALPIGAVQGIPGKGELAEPATPIPRNEAQRLGVRLFQRGF